MVTNYCDNCVMRLFNNKKYHFKGVGNPWYGTCIIVPTVDYFAYKKGDMEYSAQVKVIKDNISSTGEEDSIYITPLIKCTNYTGCIIDNNIISNCMNYLSNEFKTYNFRNVLLLGDAAKYFLNIDSISNKLNNIYISKNRRKYFINYSPNVKNFNSDNYKVFKENLIKFINSTKHSYYEHYNIVYL